MKPMIIKVCKLLIFADGYGNNIILKILLCQAPLISDFRCLLPENEYFLKSGNRIMTEDTDCVNICLKIILPKNRKNSKSGNRGWHHAAYSKKKVFR